MMILNKIAAVLVWSMAILCVMCATSSISNAQERTDSLIINVGKSKIVFLIKDKQDLETLKNYDLDAILLQLSLKLEADSTEQTLVSEQNGEKIYLSDTTIVVDRSGAEKNNENEDGERIIKSRHKKNKHFFNIDLGMNNYLQDGDFPDATNEPHTVRPLGSWYVGVNSINRTFVGGPLYLEWGPSISWYNFKFQNERIRVSEDANSTIFEEETGLPDVDFKKSKLTVAYINFSMVPMFHFGKSLKKKKRTFLHNDFWGDNINNSFRIGLGSYGGYRIASYTKVVYNDGSKQKDKDKDNYNLNNFRYGLRLQLGYKGTDFFFNYDMNELFIEEKGPKLNAFSFGIIL